MIIPYFGGRLLIAGTGDTLLLCDWLEEGSDTPKPSTMRRIACMEKSGVTPDFNAPVCNDTFLQLIEYATGLRKSFDIKFRFYGTDFQKSVWEALTDIPFGATCSYMEIAERIGNPKGVRAVAQAIGANPISVIVPCHRVIGSDGSITGYNGGIRTKTDLLSFEKSRRDD